MNLNVTFPDVARVGSEDANMADAVKDVSGREGLWVWVWVCD